MKDEDQRLLEFEREIEALRQTAFKNALSDNRWRSAAEILREAMDQIRQQIYER